VSVGSIFGEMLALQFARWIVACFQQPGAPGRSWQVVEAGAHDGQLATDILRWLRSHRRDLSSVLQYWIIEPSSFRQTSQRAKLSEFASQVRWAQDFNQLPPSPWRVIFCNELLDAMPCHRLAWDARRQTWLEWGVMWERERFCWTQLPLVDSAGVTSRACRSAQAWNLPPALLHVLPDGFTVEISLAAEDWWGQAAACLASSSGYLMTIDYGFTEEERLTSGRQHGTLRGYVRHQLADDPLICIGEQDLTANVDFTALCRIGLAANLNIDTFSTQSQFLTRLAGEVVDASPIEQSWSPSQRRQFMTLIHPEHLGRAFRVLVLKTP
jgi:SAM-dependent MidA family methyltransferase